jgi:hypothetical protein
MAISLGRWARGRLVALILVPACVAHCGRAERDGGSAPTTNACGGTAKLEHEGELGEPATPCGPCGDGILICASPNALVCLDASPGSRCSGNGGADGEGGAVDAGGSGNAASAGEGGFAGDGGGAGDTGSTGGTFAGQAGEGGQAQAGQGGDGGDPELNACGGLEPLKFENALAQPGDACGACGDGVLVCASSEILGCLGASDSSECVETNECNGTGPLLYQGEPAQIGESCGPCEDGVLGCTGQFLGCYAATPAGYCDSPEAAPNQCGGLGPTLHAGEPSTPGLACGACGTYRLACASPNQLVCYPAHGAQTCSAPEEPTCTIPESAYAALLPSPPAPPAETAPAQTTTLELPLLANDLVYNPFDGLIYASVPGAQGTNGNSIASIDPESGTVNAYMPVGSDPTTLALSDDGEVLWVALASTGRVRKVDLIDGVAGMEFSLGDGALSSTSDGYLAVLPGTHDSLLVARGRVTVYDAGVPRPRSSGGASSQVVNTGSPLLAFGMNTQSTAFDFNRICVNEQGAFLQQSSGDVFQLFNQSFVFADGVIYGSRGVAYGVEASAVIGSYGAGQGSLAVDTFARRVFLQDQYSQGTIRAYDMDTFVSLGAEQFPVGSVSSLVRWGRYGLAFRSADSAFSPANVVIVRTTLGT